METFEYQGRTRRTAGRLHYPDAPEPGTLVGPNAFGEVLVVLTTIGADTWLSPATNADVTRAAKVGDPLGLRGARASLYQRAAS